MATIRVRSDGVELELANEVELEGMRARGLLDPGAERWDGEAWVLLARTSRTARAADPWSAWSAADAGAAAPPPPEDDVADLPVAAVAPMPRPVVSRGIEAIPDVAITPLHDEPPAAAATTGAAPPPVAAPRPRPPATAPPPPVSPGEVIDFPRRAREPVRPPPADAPAPLVRPGRLFGMILVLMLLLGGAWAVLELSSPTAAPVVSVGKARTPRPVDPLAAVEAELRKAHVGPVREVRGPGDLDDALLLDLQQLGVQVVSVRAPVVRWTGRKKDDPAAAEVHVTFKPGPDQNRDLGAIGLAVGRYKLKYNLQVEPFEIIMESEGTGAATTLDPAVAERFVQGRARLSELVAP